MKNFLSCLDSNQISQNRHTENIINGCNKIIQKSGEFPFLFFSNLVMYLAEVEIYHFLNQFLLCPLILFILAGFSVPRKTI